MPPDVLDTPELESQLLRLLLALFLMLFGWSGTKSQGLVCCTGLTDAAAAATAASASARLFRRPDEEDEDEEDEEEPEVEEEEEEVLDEQPFVAIAEGAAVTEASVVCSAGVDVVTVADVAG